MTRCAEQHKGKNGQGDYNDVMVAHDEYIGTGSASWMNSASPTIISSCTQPTAAPTGDSWPDAGITPFRGEKNTDREDERRYRSSCAGPRGSKPAWF